MTSLKRILDKYTYTVEWSEENKIHIARCIEFPAIAAEGITAEKALDEMKMEIYDIIHWLTEDNELIPCPLGSTIKQKYVQ